MSLSDLRKNVFCTRPVSALCFCGLAYFVIAPGTASGLLVHTQNGDSGSVPELTYEIGSGSSLELVLDIQNESELSSRPIFLWQLKLHLQGVADASGQLDFQSVTAPDSSLFGNDPGPIPLTELPSDEAVISDADPQFNGVIIQPHMTIPIAKLQLMPTANTQGAFVLSMATFDVNQIDTTSYWTADDFEPTPFDNPVSDPERIDLALIHVVAGETLIGDFNHDLVVDAADYTVWRDGLGDEFLPGQYDDWKAHFGEMTTGLGQAVLSPEPSTLWLALGAGAFLLLARSLDARS